MFSFTLSLLLSSSLIYYVNFFLLFFSFWQPLSKKLGKQRAPPPTVSGEMKKLPIPSPSPSPSPSYASPAPSSLSPPSPSSPPSSSSDPSSSNVVDITSNNSTHSGSGVNWTTLFLKNDTKLKILMWLKKLGRGETGEGRGERGGEGRGEGTGETGE